MPWFFFHLLTPTGRDDADTGVEFANVNDAYLEACRTISAISAELVHSKANPLMHAFEIADPNGKILMEVPFAEVLDLGGVFERQSATKALEEAKNKVVRGKHLIAALHQEHAALRETLAETYRLLALSRPKKGWQF